MDAPRAWNELTAVLLELEVLEGALGLLSWDQQTYMPKAATAARGEQLALLSRLYHERLTDPRIPD